MKISNTGYKNNSKDKKEKSLIIPSNKITMKNVPHNVFGVDNLGNGQMMYPNNDYSFPGDYVTEYPMMQNGGQYLSPAKWNQLQMQQGMMASPGYSTNTVNKNKSYLEFYDPNQFMPVPDASGVIGWSKIGDPSYKYTDESNSPFIKYTPPKENLTPQKTYIENNPNRKPFQFGPNQNFDPNTGNYFTGPTPLADGSNIIQPLTKKMGGSLNKFMTNYYKQFGGAQGNEQIQGKSIDQFLQEKNNTFVDFLADNAGKFLYRDEAKNFMQNGGQFNNGPFGPYADNGVPDYVSSVNAQYNFPNSQNNSNGQYQFGMTQNGMDPNQVSYDTDMENRMRELEATNNQTNNNYNNVADLSMAGVQTLNNLFSRAQDYKQKKWLQEQQSISNTSPSFYGSKGNYDVNQGNIRPNQMTPSYKKGGEYKMSKKEVNALIAAGYNIEFLD